MARTPKILILAGLRFYIIGTVRDHIDSFLKYSKYDYDLYTPSYAEKYINLADYQAIIIHYSNRLDKKKDFSEILLNRIHNFKGLKIVFLQDEYCRINNNVDALASAKIDILYTVVNPEVIDKIYHDYRLKNVKKNVCLTGYLPEYLCDLSHIPYLERPIDVSYRARRVPYWLGELAQNKWQIGEQFKKHPNTKGLQLDIEYQEHKRIYGKDWIKFLSLSKAVLGSESSISVCDFDGSIERNVDEYLRKFPNASFEEVRDLFFKEVDGKISINVISPRIFEYAACRNLMILHEGNYSGILKKWVHYVPIKHDFSNIDEVFDLIKSPGKAQEIINNAYSDLILSNKWNYSSFIKEFDLQVSEYIGFNNTSKLKSTGQSYETRFLILRETLIEKFRLKLISLIKYTQLYKVIKKFTSILILMKLKEKP